VVDSIKARIDAQNEYLDQIVPALAEQIEQANEQTKTVASVADAVKAIDDRITALEKAVGERPRRASRAAETVVDEDDTRVKEAEAAQDGERTLFGRFSY
jgi:cell pole-organizing protein PopZ